MLKAKSFSETTQNNVSQSPAARANIIVPYDSTSTTSANSEILEVAKKSNVVAISTLLQKAAMTNQVTQSTLSKPLQRVRISATSPAYGVLFSDTAEDTKVHFIPDINRYVQCNGENCVVCNSGIQVEERYLLPMFSAVSEDVEVLPVSKAMRPGSAFPQILNVLKNQLDKGLTDQLVVIQKEGKYKFNVTTKPHQLTPSDLATIKAFVDDYSSKKFALSDVFDSLSNDEILQQSQEVRRKIRLRTLEDTNVFNDVTTS